MTIFDRIRERRKELEWSQERLAKELGLKSRAAISAVEKGHCDMTTDRIKRYAEALHTTPAYLMGWNNDPNARMTLAENINYCMQRDIEHGDFELPPIEEGLPEDERNILLAYRAGEYKKIVSLMMDKMTEGK